MSQNLDSIEDMEAMAQNEADGSCNKRMFGKWLEVSWSRNLSRFTYTYNNKRIRRDAAAALCCRSFIGRIANDTTDPRNSY